VLQLGQREIPGQAGCRQHGVLDLAPIQIRNPTHSG
jgi:hypothetical protein